MMRVAGKFVSSPKERAEVADQVRDGLDAGFSTEEIAADLGVEYDSIITRFRRHGDQEELRRRLMRKRAAEADVKRLAGYERWIDRNRCVHGAWTKSGNCEHGAMGRYAA